ncbi:MAG: hypothetical protein AAGI24_14915, partial [Pseudomonadota bacterium]
AHGALGQHFEGNSRERIQRVFTYREHSDAFSDREYAAFSFLEAGLKLPTTITPEMIENLRSHRKLPRQVDSSEVEFLADRSLAS